MELRSWLGLGLITSLMVVSWFYAKSERLEAELVVSTAKNSQVEANNIGLVKELGKLKESIENNAVTYDSNIKTYEEALKNIKENVKYVEVKSDECKDIKVILDDIRSNGY